MIIILCVGYSDLEGGERLNSSGRSPMEGVPNYQSAIHDVGNLKISIGNTGRLGRGILDEHHVGWEYPANSGLYYIKYYNLWIGGIVGSDTLVSSAGRVSITNKFHPAAFEAGEIEHRSAIEINPHYHDSAKADQEFVMYYSDTVTKALYVYGHEYDNKPHIPLHVEVKQTSYAWAVEYVDNMILIDYRLKNIGVETIKEMYPCIAIYNLSGHVAREELYEIDNISGYLQYIDLPEGSCQAGDSVNILWGADNDGGPNEEGQFDFASAVDVAGIQLLRIPDQCDRVNYNWWANSGDFGPRLAPTDDDPYYEFGTGLGEPYGDKNRYYVLSHREIDYGQMFTVLSHVNEGFMPPPARDIAVEIADGEGTEDVLSFGPIDLEPGDTCSFTIAIIMGDDFHVNPLDYEDNFTAYNPQKYFDLLDFSGLSKTARLAKAVYDNPGFDTDLDGYAGEYCMQYILDDLTDNGIADSIPVDSFRLYYTGDGVPDYRPMSPPPPPEVTVTSEYGKVTVHWYGKNSELTPDYFSGELDFEGYNIYIGDDNRLTDFSLIRSYDKANYIIYEFNTHSLAWQKITQSGDLDSLQNIYGPDFDPTQFYDPEHSLHNYKQNRVFYFVNQGWNQSDLTNPYGIRKVYPDADPDDASDVTAEGQQRYYMYEYSIDNLQPSRPYYFAVTAFDYGAGQYDIGSLETSPLTTAIREYPLISSDTVEHLGLKVLVYPNPYRIDGGYARAGYENRARDRSAEWGRRIHFANLPSVCTIRIFTLTGDLVQEIKHFNPGGGPESQHQEWNVISRNTQAVVSGIYLWSVRSEMGEQVGKLVIIK